MTVTEIVLAVLLGIIFTVNLVAVVVLFAIRDLLNRLAPASTPVELAALIEFYTLTGGQKTKVVKMNLKDSDKVSLSIAIKDAKGNPAQVDGIPVWSVTDPSLASLNVSADGMSADLLASGPLGSCQVQVNADADLGAGVTSILGTLDLTIIAGDAVSIDIAAGVPSAQ